jgi:hypothetical protein
VIGRGVAVWKFRSRLSPRRTIFSGNLMLVIRRL